MAHNLKLKIRKVVSFDTFSREPMILIFVDTVCFNIDERINDRFNII